MDKAQIEQQIAQLEAQRDQALMQLGGINGALAVYRQMLAWMPDAPPAGRDAQEAKPHDE